MSTLGFEHCWTGHFTGMDTAHKLVQWLPGETITKCSGTTLLYGVCHFKLLAIKGLWEGKKLGWAAYVRVDGTLRIRWCCCDKGGLSCWVIGTLGLECSSSMQWLSLRWQEHAHIAPSGVHFVWEYYGLLRKKRRVIGKCHFVWWLLDKFVCWDEMYMLQYQPHSYIKLGQQGLSNALLYL